MRALECGVVTWAVIGLGSNLGARRATLDAARAILDAQPGLRVLASSRLYRTAAWGPPQPDYLNAALRVEWVGHAEGLFALLRHVEALLRRERVLRWGPRTLDLDLLDWAGGKVSSHGLTVPHSRLLERDFALGPLLDVTPERTAWRPVLAALGGAPSDACDWDGGDFASEPTANDSLERACLAVTQAFVASETRALSTHAFVVPRQRFDAVDDGSLLARAQLAMDNGFAVARAVVTSADPLVVSGVLVGERRNARTP